MANLIDYKKKYNPLPHSACLLQFANAKTCPPYRTLGDLRRCSHNRVQIVTIPYGLEGTADLTAYDWVWSDLPRGGSSKRRKDYRLAKRLLRYYGYY